MEIKNHVEFYSRNIFCILISSPQIIWIVEADILLLENYNVKITFVYKI